MGRSGRGERNPAVRRGGLIGVLYYESKQDKINHAEPTQESAKSINETASNAAKLAQSIERS